MLFTATKSYSRRQAKRICEANIIKGLQTRGLDSIFIGKGDRWQIYFILIQIWWNLLTIKMLYVLFWMKAWWVSQMHAWLHTYKRQSSSLHCVSTHMLYIRVLWWWSTFLYAIDFFLLKLTFSLTIIGKYFFLKVYYFT